MISNYFLGLTFYIGHKNKIKFFVNYKVFEHYTKKKIANAFLTMIWLTCGHKILYSQHNHISWFKIKLIGEMMMKLIQKHFKMKAFTIER